MCFSYHLFQDAVALEKRYNAVFNFSHKVNFTDFPVNGFARPWMPIISFDNTDQFTMAQWGLIPGWVKDIKDFKANTLNARMEELSQKASYRNSVNNRCIVPADSFYEYHWLDLKGKAKQKYELHLENDEIFSFPAIFSDWKEPATGNVIRTYSLLTTVGTGLMKEVHNSRPNDPRMVIVLNPENEKDFLETGKIEMINDRLLARKVS